MSREAHFRRLVPLDHPEEAALLVVDMQKGFLSPNLALEVPSGVKIIPIINKMIGVCRSLNIPVIFTKFVYHPNVPTWIGELHPEHKPAIPGEPTGFGKPSDCCVAGSDSVHLHPEINYESRDLIIEKPGYDAFHSSQLEDYLRVNGIKTLLLAGVMTDVCVLFTASGAIHRHFKAAVLSDAVATLNDEIQRWSLDLLGRALARCVDTDQAISELRSVGDMCLNVGV